MTIRERISKMTKTVLEREINTYENLSAIGGNDMRYLDALYIEVDKRDYNMIMARKITLE